MNKNIKSLIVTIVFFFMLVIIIGAFAFSYFSGYLKKYRNSNLNVSISNSYSPVFVAYPDGDLEINVNSSLMDYYYVKGVDNFVVGTDSQNIVVSLMGGSSDNAVTCSFDFSWKDTGDVYKKTNNTTKEYTIQIDEGNTNVLAEKNMDLVLATPLLYSGTITSTGTLVEKNYLVTMRFYNVNVIQVVYDKHYTGEIDVTNVACVEAN